MFRMCGKLMKSNKTLKEHIAVIDDFSLTRTKKVYTCLDEIAYAFDIEKPIWLESNKKDFIRCAKTRFTKDSFIEDVDFDYLDFQVIEEDFM